MKKIVLFFIGVLFFAGCSVKTTPVYVTFKSPKLKISDQGFLKEGPGYKEFELYKGGVGYKLTLKNSVVCINGQCMDKGKFIKEYLGEEYPSDFFDKVIEGKPIENFGKIIRKGDGFVQKKGNILYSVKKNGVLFKDKSKNIILLIKKLRERG